MAVQEQEITTPVVAGRWELDPSHSRVEFWARHLGLSKVRGRFNEFSADITVGETLDATRVAATMKAESIETRFDQRDQHLRSADFLDIEKYSDVTFVSKAIERAGDGEYKVHGDFTIRDVTRPLTLDLEIHGEVDDPMMNTKRAGFSATAQFDREDFGMTWNGAVEIGGLVGKKVHIEIEGEALLQQDA